MAYYGQVQKELGSAKSFRRQFGNLNGRFLLEPAVLELSEGPVVVQRLCDLMDGHQPYPSAMRMSHGMGPASLASVSIDEEAIVNVPASMEHLVESPASVEVPGSSLALGGVPYAANRVTEMVQKLNFDDQLLVNEMEGIPPFIPLSTENSCTRVTGIDGNTLKKLHLGVNEDSSRDVPGQDQAIQAGLWPTNVTKVTGNNKKSLKRLHLEFCALRQGVNESVSAFADRVEGIAMNLAKIRLEAGLKQPIKRYLEILNGGTFAECRQKALKLEEVISWTSEAEVARDTEQIARVRRMKGSSARPAGMERAASGGKTAPVFGRHDSSSQGRIGKAYYKRINRNSVASSLEDREARENEYSVLLRAHTKFKVCFNCGDEGHATSECEILLGDQEIEEVKRSNSTQKVDEAQSYERSEWLGNIADCHKLKKFGKKLGITTSTRIGDEDVNQQAVSVFNSKRNRDLSEECTSIHRASTSEQLRHIMTYRTVLESAKLASHLGHSSITERMIRPADSGEIKNYIFFKAKELRKRTAFLVDTGATASVIRIGELQSGVSIIYETVKLRGIAKRDMETLGKVVIYLENGHMKLGHEFHIVSNEFPCSGGILGSDFLESKDLDVRIDVGKYLLLNGIQYKLRQNRVPAQHEFEILRQDELVSKPKSVHRLEPKKIRTKRNCAKSMAGSLQRLQKDLTMRHITKHSTVHNNSASKGGHTTRQSNLQSMESGIMEGKSRSLYGSTIRSGEENRNFVQSTWEQNKEDWEARQRIQALIKAKGLEALKRKFNFRKRTIEVQGVIPQSKAGVRDEIIGIGANGESCEECEERKKSSDENLVTRPSELIYDSQQNSYQKPRQQVNQNADEFCSFCYHKNHSIMECRKLKKAQRIRENATKICDFCQRVNHTTMECFKLQRKTLNSSTNRSSKIFKYDVVIEKEHFEVTVEEVQCQKVRFSMEVIGITEHQLGESREMNIDLQYMWHIRWQNACCVRSGTLTREFLNAQINHWFYGNEFGKNKNMFSFEVKMSKREEDRFPSGPSGGYYRENMSIVGEMDIVYTSEQTNMEGTWNDTDLAQLLCAAELCQQKELNEASINRQHVRSIIFRLVRRCELEPLTQKFFSTRDNLLTDMIVWMSLEQELQLLLIQCNINDGSLSGSRVNGSEAADQSCSGLLEDRAVQQQGKNEAQGHSSQSGPEFTMRLANFLKVQRVEVAVVTGIQTVFGISHVRKLSLEGNGNSCLPDMRVFPHYFNSLEGRISVNEVDNTDLTQITYAAELHQSKKLSEASVDRQHVQGIGLRVAKCFVPKLLMRTYLSAWNVARQYGNFKQRYQNKLRYRKTQKAIDYPMRINFTSKFRGDATQISSTYVDLRKVKNGIFTMPKNERVSRKGFKGNTLKAKDRSNGSKTYLFKEPYNYYGTLQLGVRINKITYSTMAQIPAPAYSGENESRCGRIMVPAQRTVRIGTSLEIRTSPTGKMTRHGKAVMEKSPGGTCVSFCKQQLVLNPLLDFHPAVTRVCNSSLPQKITNIYLNVIKHKVRKLGEVRKIEILTGIASSTIQRNPRQSLRKHMRQFKRTTRGCRDSNRSTFRIRREGSPTHLITDDLIITGARMTVSRRNCGHFRKICVLQKHTLHFVVESHMIKRLIDADCVRRLQVNDFWNQKCNFSPVEIANQHFWTTKVGRNDQTNSSGNSSTRRADIDTVVAMLGSIVQLRGEESSAGNYCICTVTMERCVKRNGAWKLGRFRWQWIHGRTHLKRYYLRTFTKGRDMKRKSVFTALEVCGRQETVRGSTSNWSLKTLTLESKRRYVEGSMYCRRSTFRRRQHISRNTCGFLTLKHEAGTRKYLKYKSEVESINRSKVEIRKCNLILGNIFNICKRKLLEMLCKRKLSGITIFFPRGEKCYIPKYSRLIKKCLTLLNISQSIIIHISLINITYEEVERKNEFNLTSHVIGNSAVYCHT